MTSYKVTGAYVTVKVRDDRGQLMTLGFYQGGLLPEGADRADVERLLRKGLLAEEGTPEADAAVPHGVPVEFDELGHAQPQKPAPAGKAAAEQGDKYDAMKLDQLQADADKRKLPTSGRKDELAARLREHDAAHAK